MMMECNQIWHGYENITSIKKIKWLYHLCDTFLEHCCVFFLLTVICDNLITSDICICFIDTIFRDIDNFIVNNILQPTE